MKKGQAALEYLLTYGWAILIVIIVGASLYSLGIFTPGQWTGRRQTGFANFRIEDFKLDRDGNLTIVYRNQIGKPLQVNEIRAEFKNEVCSFTTTHNVELNKMYTRVLDCSDWKPLSLRSSFTIILDFHYTDPDSGLTHVDSGTLFGQVEPADD